MYGWEQPFVSPLWTGYLATAKLSFLVVLVLFAFAGAVLFFGSGRFRRRCRTGIPQEGREVERTWLSTAAAISSAVRRVSTGRILKLVALAVWLLAWSVLASLYAKVAQNANFAALTLLVLAGGFSPVLIYAGLETGVRKLGRRMQGPG